MIPRVHCRQRFITQAATAWALCALLGLRASTGRADEASAGDTEAALRLIESTERSLDPLGIDEATGKGLDEAARALKPKTVALPMAESGDVLTAIAGIQEQSHSIAIKLEAGLAYVEHTLTFVNRTPHSAELAYRLRVPRDSAVWGLEVCKGQRCSEGARLLLDPSTRDGKADRSLPETRLNVIELSGQRALAIHVNALDKEPLTIRIRYVTEAPVHAGRVRMSLPARGFDPRIVASTVSVEAPGLVAEQGEVGSERSIDPTLPIEVLRVLSAPPAPLTQRARSVCDGAPCSREFRAAAAQPIRARETWLVIDASPSMEGEARGRVLPVLAALLSRLPDETRVRAFAFAAEARELGSWPAIEAPLSKLGDAELPEGGSATHLSSVLDGFHEALAKHKPRIIVLSDGALDPGVREQRALERARRAGAELSLIALSNDAPGSRVVAGFESGQVLHVTDRADRALGQGELDSLADSLSTLLSSRISKDLRAGESRSIERVATPRKIGQHGSDFLPAWLGRHAAAPTWVTGTASELKAIAAPAFVSIPKAEAAPATGMPKVSVLDLLRTQLVPKARACLRDDRKGRADYAVGLSFRFLLARREIVDAAVEGDLPPALERCLLEVLPRLKLPWFTGTMRVRYPIHTEREAEPPVIELAPDAAAEVERALKTRPAPRPARRAR